MAKTQEEQIKEFVDAEWVKCGLDPVYFMKKYCVIQHPKRGKIPFATFDYQMDLLDDFINRRFNIILKARQLGISTIVAGYALWLMTFATDKNILVIATQQDTAKNMVTKVRVMYDGLPSWLKAKTEEYNKLSIRFENGSQIKAISSNESAGRSESLSLLVLDEAAFIDRIDDIWTAAQQTLSTGGSCVALSTPNGIGNWFHREYTKALEGTNYFNPIKLFWDVHPDHDQVWRDQQDIELGPDQAAQECDCDFLTSGRSVIDPEILQAYKDHKSADGNPDIIIPPIEKRGLDGNFWVWKIPNYDKPYIVCADVARGDGEDFSAFHILDADSIEQVGEYKGKITPKDFGNLLVNTSVEYNNALLIVENANVGYAAIQQIIDRGYDNLFYMSKDLKYVDTFRQVSNNVHREERQMVPGFSTTPRTRPLIIDKLREYFQANDIIPHSRRLLDELAVFIYINHREQAMRGYNDDLVMALAIGLWVRDTAMKLRAEGINLTKQTLDRILDAPAVLTQNTNRNDFWEMSVGPNREKIDLTEWLDF